MEGKVAQFLEVTGTGSPEIAQYYLEVGGGDLQTAIEMLFEDGGSEVTSVAPGMVSDFSEMTILEWNIQGLLDDFIRERTIAIIDLVKQTKPVVIMMQEVTIPIFSYLKSSLKTYYNCYSSAELRRDVVVPYFTAIFVMKDSFTASSAKVIPFQMSQQGRDLLIVEGRYGTHDFALLTSHVESMKNQAAERKRQMVQIYEVMVAMPASRNVIFGGDTNLKDAEFNSVVQCGKFDVAKVNDVWNILGSPQDTRYSWDLLKNDNQIKGGQARLRYERLYARIGSSGRIFKPTAMKFVGTERLPCGLFPSDHWGILTTFTL